MNKEFFRPKTPRGPTRCNYPFSLRERPDNLVCRCKHTCATGSPIFFCVVGSEGSRNETETMRTCSLGFQTAAGVSAREFTNYRVHNLRSTTIFGEVGVLHKFILHPYFCQSLISRSHSSTKFIPSQHSASALFCGCALIGDWHQPTLEQKGTYAVPELRRLT